MIKGTKDFWAGAVFVAFGAAALMMAQSYSLGIVSRMGPGYFPRMLSILLMVVGGVSIVRSFFVAREALPAFALRPALVVIGSLVACGYLLPRAGLVIALSVLMFGAASASEKFRAEWKKLILLTAATIAFCAIVFVQLLGISLPLVGSWFG
ncbi:tripartite tricarboxylate transporter TctB family protein [Xanthobacteraceae bacterium Astr-EGSB]|uniref:tripartite tricarboxylate transporter TctB family protein n=1 Tax=Astrobacterium formosum TaxID=3069710 RepID=UPI0027AF2E27|nr:tripartite tricarboxylate transporter TctB family protein [Xanthobacteraceae bacterium Astr-EGSB]